MINPMQLIQMLQGSGNPMQMLMGMAQTNPALGQAMRMVNGKTPAEIERMAYDMAKQLGRRGIVPASPEKEEIKWQIHADSVRG